jgi:hypothetical protein
METEKRPGSAANTGAGGQGTQTWAGLPSSMITPKSSHDQIPARFIPYSFEAAEQLYLQRRRHGLEPGVHLH